MKPKGKLFALLAIFAAIGLVTATGAFTTVSAARTADVSVAGDSAALLAIAPAGGPNSNYVSVTNDQVSIDFSAGGQGASGVNQRAETDVRSVFTITNQGTQEVGIWIEKIDSADTDNSASVAFYSTNASAAAVTNAIAFTGGDMVTPGNRIDLSGIASGNGDPFRLDYASESNYVELGPGESVTISIFIDLSPGSISNSEDLLDEIVIHADAGLADGTDSVTGPE